VAVKRNEVESQDAELEASKYEVMTGWLEAINIASKVATWALLGLRAPGGIAY
jgi:hypothetical protein